MSKTQKLFINNHLTLWNKKSNVSVLRFNDCYKQKKKVNKRQGRRNQIIKSDEIFIVSISSCGSCPVQLLWSVVGSANLAAGKVVHDSRGNSYRATVRQGTLLHLWRQQTLIYKRMNQFHWRSLLRNIYYILQVGTCNCEPIKLFTTIMLMTLQMFHFPTVIKNRRA